MPGEQGSYSSDEGRGQSVRHKTREGRLGSSVEGGAQLAQLAIPG
jgi:hypothetical protein